MIPIPTLLTFIMYFLFLLVIGFYFYNRSTNIEDYLLGGRRMGSCGPLILFALFSRKTTWQAALAGMVTGTVVLVLWKQSGLIANMYEIDPGFCANSLAIIIVNLLVKQKNENVLQEYSKMIASLIDR